MAGHSHWSQIKRAKGAADVKRGQLFSRMAREIQMAAKLGGGDMDMNPRLRAAILAARAESMPADTIERAVKKGTGELAGGTLEEGLYEGYAPGGVALMIETTTDNKNRTAAEIRAIFTKRHGSMGTPNSVAWMFQRRGIVSVPLAVTTEEAVMDATLDAGADDIRMGDEAIEVVTPPDRLYAVESALKAAGITVASAKFTYFPTNLTQVTDEKVAQQVMALIEALDDHDDVQNVHSNVEMSEELMARLGAG